MGTNIEPMGWGSKTPEYGLRPSSASRTTGNHPTVKPRTIHRSRLMCFVILPCRTAAVNLAALRGVVFHRIVRQSGYRTLAVLSFRGPFDSHNVR